MSLNHWSFWFTQNQDQSWQIHQLVSHHTPTKYTKYTYVSCYILGSPLRRTPYPPWFQKGMLRAEKVGASWKSPFCSKSISWVVRESRKIPIFFGFYVTGKWHLPQRCTKTWWKMVGKVVWSIVQLLHICKIHVRTCWVLVSFCSYWVVQFLSQPLLSPLVILLPGGGKWTKGSRKCSRRACLGNFNFVNNPHIIYAIHIRIY